ncbi:MAG TPA: PGPGW domain-containing protein [Thermoleophilaceae bacterium]|nr:PGPGW domain-containing protein [Thermoleophilaceae bacterium]
MAERAENGFVERLQRRLDRERERYESRGRVYKTAWVTAAVLIIVFGLAIGIFPGPGPTVLVPVGLAMLSLQFARAQRILDKGLEAGAMAGDKVAAASREQKILAVAAAVFGAAAAVVVLVLVLM